ncbi:3-hydroxyanthranilate 3,4-dioxygenase family protein, partial [Oesophagostomum dentatum]
QRFADTIGFVVERTRENTEFDCVRYFVESSTERLFERWFHLTDVVRDLPPLIKAFHASDEHKTGMPGQKSFLVNAPYDPIVVDLPEPINLRNFISEHSEAMRNGPVQIYGAPIYSTEVYLYGEGEYQLEDSGYELLIWTMSDSEAVLETSRERRVLEANSMTIAPPRSKHQLTVKRSQVITLRMKPSS